MKPGGQRLAVLLSMAMFVLVVDTSIMNVSISAVVHDLDTDVSSVQAAISLEALVSAAFILIGSKVGDLIGRKRAYVLGLLGYAIGAVAMALAQGLVVVIVFWAIIGGLGASLLLPSMQSLIHGNFEGDAQKRVYTLVGAAAAIAAAVGPLLGGFITTYLSWRVAFLLEAVIIGIVLTGIGLVRDVPYTGSRAVDPVGAALSVVGMGGLVLGILLWQEGGDAVGAVLALGVVAIAGLAWWLVRRKRAGRPTLIDPDLLRSKLFRLGISGQMMQQIALGGMMIALPIFLQMVLEYNAMTTGFVIAPLSLSMFGMALLAGKRAGRRRPSTIIRGGFAILALGVLALIAVVPRADSGWYLLVPLLLAGSGLGLLVSQLNNYTLSPISEERVSEAAGVNSAAGSFGLSFGLAFAGAIMLATLSFTFTNMADASDVLKPAQQEQVADALEHDAEVMSNTQLEQQLEDQPEAVRDEILRINTDARPVALQVALLIPLVAALLGFVTSWRMSRLPDPEPSNAGAAAFGDAAQPREARAPLWGLRTTVASAVVLAYATMAPRLVRRRAALAAIVGSGAAVATARAWGLSWSQLGLDPSRAGRSARVGVVASIPIAAVVVAGARHPTTRPMFADDRVVERTNREAAYELFVRIPVVTAAAEEIVFRSVLLGISSQWLGMRRAQAWTSLVFGVWHVVPALHSHRSNAAAAGAMDQVGGRAAMVAGTVGATAVAGVGLCELRLRTKSVLASIFVHAAINGVAFVVARAIARRPNG